MWLTIFIVLGSCAHSYSAALDDSLLNLVYFLLERAIASVHGAPSTSELLTVCRVAYKLKRKDDTKETTQNRLTK